MSRAAQTMSGLKLDESHWAAAYERVMHAPVYKNSHREVAANEVGFLGEVIVEA